jgi:quinol monooxygenase YgiN
MNLKLMPVPHRTSELIDALRVQMSRTQAQPGCLECHISQDSEEKNIVLYQEEWNSWHELEKHIRSERFAWILELMEQSSKTPYLKFCDVHQTRGMEYVRKLRKMNKR